jgi:alpha-tubulin suppressor-like RCC1 family protein
LDEKLAINIASLICKSLTISMEVRDLADNFVTIPLEVIKNFLEYHSLNVPRDIKEIYQVAWEYLNHLPGLVIPFLPINDFVLARNLEGQISARHSSSSILNSNEKELRDLARSLGLPEVSRHLDFGDQTINRERIIRILGYLNLLDNDGSVFDLLPKDILKIIGQHLDYCSLGFFSRISRRFHQLFGVTGELIEIIRNRLEEITWLNLSHFTEDQLGLLIKREKYHSSLSAGGYHSMVLNSQGGLWGFGRNLEGQLGMGIESMAYVSSPIKIPWFDEIAVISTGINHSLALSSQGQIFSFGRNGGGQLGTGDWIYKMVPTLVSVLGETSIIAISAGGFHSLALDSRGQVLSCGDNQNGQLGHGDSKDRLIFTLIDDPNFDRITDISAGFNHSLILDHRGRVFSFGSNDCGKLGLGDDIHRSSPTLIETSGLGKVVTISTKDEHSLLLNSEGQVFGFGYNEMGQLGLGHEENISTPTLINLPNIIAISTGRTHSLFLNAQGQVFGCGGNPYGQLGFDGEDDQLSLPTLIDFPGIVAISAGGFFSLFLDAQGRVFSCGSNENGSLGLGDFESRTTPTLIEGFVI